MSESGCGEQAVDPFNRELEPRLKAAD